MYSSLGQGPGWKEQGGLTTTQREGPASQPLIGGFWRSLAVSPYPAQVLFHAALPTLPSSPLLSIYWSILRTMPAVGPGERFQMDNR